jgi:hypothetical protein
MIRFGCGRPHGFGPTIKQICHGGFKGANASSIQLVIHQHHAHLDLVVQIELVSSNKSLTIVFEFQVVGVTRDNFIAQGYFGKRNHVLDGSENLQGNYGGLCWLICVCGGGKGPHLPVACVNLGENGGKLEQSR